MMMLKLLHSTLLASLLWVVAATARAETDRATADKLMSVSGLSQQFEVVAQHIRLGQSKALSQGNTTAAPVEIERITRIAESSFNAQRLRAVALNVIANDTDAADVPALLAWYESPEGLAMTRIEEKAAKDDRDPATIMQKGAALLNTLAAPRQALLMKFVDVTRSAEAMANTTTNIGIAIQMGAASADPAVPGVPADALRRAFAVQRPQMLKAFSAFSLASFAELYAEVSDADLARYIDFMQSSAGARFLDTGLRAVDAALVDGAAEFGRNIPSAREKSGT